MPNETSSTPVIDPSQSSSKPSRSRLPIVAAVLFLCVMGGVFFWLGNQSALDQARKAAAAGDVAQATRAFDRHLEKHPRDWQAQLEYGTFLKQHDAATALLLLQRIPRTSSEFVSAARQIAQIAIVGKRNSLAEAALKNVYAENPNDFEIAQALMLLYYEQEKNREALPFAVKCTELKPDQIENFLLLSQIYFKVGRPSEMAEPLLKALKIDPENREAHLNLAYSYLQQAQFDKAREHGEWSRKNDPGNVQVWRVLAQIERDDTHDDLALKYAREGLKIDPDELECRVLEGQILAFQKKFQEAYDRMLPFYDLHPREQRVVGVLAQSAKALGRNDEAAKFQKLLVELGNENYRAETTPKQ